MVDLSVIKKGLNFHGTTEANLQKERVEIEREKERMEREQNLMNKTNRSFKDSSKEETKSKAKEETKDVQEADDAQEGVLKMIQVQNLQDDVDAIVGMLKTLDFSK